MIYCMAWHHSLFNRDVTMTSGMVWYTPTTMVVLMLCAQDIELVDYICILVLK